MKPLLSIIITLSCLFTLTAQNFESSTVVTTYLPTQYSVNLKYDSIAPPWNKIDLTGRRMKSNLVVVPNRRKSLWLPVGGGIIIGGGVLYILTKDTPTSDTKQPLITSNDTIIIDCNTNTTLDVLANDTGQGLFISSVSSVSQASVQLSMENTLLLISNITSPDNFSFTIIIEDKHGQTATSTVTVQVAISPIIASDDQYEAGFGQVLSTNVLANDNGSELSISEFSDTDGGVVNIEENGNLTFTPSDGFVGTTSFNYTINGLCDQTATATVSITVAAPDCTFETSIMTSPAHCGQEDGQAILTTFPDGAYTYSWDNGANSAQEQLGSGTYNITITSPNGFCIEELTITIDELPIEFNAIFDTEAANCGLENGSITTTVTPEGDYDAIWSNGESNLNINHLAPGEYAVTLTNENDCSNNFTTIIEETATINANNIQVFQPTCSSTGNIQFTATSTDDELIMMEVLHGGDHELFTIEPGFISLAEYLNILGGDYHITIWNANTSADCSDNFSVTVDEVSALEIVLENITPPSSSSADDGLITIFVAASGLEPYTIFLDGVMTATATGSTITIEGITEGEHSVHILDSSGCLSNILNFFVPFTGFGFQLGIVTNISPLEVMESEVPLFTKPYTLRPGISLSSSYLVANLEQFSRISFFPNYSHIRTTDQLSSFIKLEQMVSLITSKSDIIGLSLNTGLIMDIPIHSSRIQTYWQTNICINKEVFRHINIEVSASLKGWKQVNRPIVDVRLCRTIK